MAQHTVVPLRPRVDAPEALGCTDRSRVLGAFADVLDLVGEAVTATTVCVGAALGAALPPARRVHVSARDDVGPDHDRHRPPGFGL